jgi:hypothetical protein
MERKLTPYVSTISAIEAGSLSKGRNAYRVSPNGIFRHRLRMYFWCY